MDLSVLNVLRFLLLSLLVKPAVRAKCSGLSATLWSWGLYSTGQTRGSAVSSPLNGCKPVVRGLLDCVGVPG